MSKKLSRRQALMSASALMGAATFSDPLKVMFQGILKTMINEAIAAEAGIVYNPRTYIGIQLPGAPSRWTWQPLVPFESVSNMIPNPNVVTRFKSSSSSYTAGEYAITNQKGINMPWMWQFNIPTSRGGDVPMNSIMDYALFLRGVDVNNPSHTAARGLQFYPGSSTRSVTALPGDYGDAPIAALNMGSSSWRYTSQHGNSSTTVNGYASNVLQTILDAFNVNISDTMAGDLNKVDQAVQDAFANLKLATKEYFPGRDTIFNTNKGAEDIIRGKFYEGAQQYGTLRAKYKALIDKAGDPLVYKLARISDLPVSSGTDMRSTLSGAKRSYKIAEGFAVSEYIVKNNLSNSIAFSVRGFIGQNFDEHTIDWMKVMFYNTFFNRMMATAVYEFEQSLGSKFNDVVINISGEFGRTPKKTGAGSDHGSHNGNNTFFCGAIKKPLVVGNIAKGRTDGTYPGTYGVRANNSGYGPITMGSLGSTIASLLRVPSDVTAVGSPIEEVNGEIVSKLGTPKIV